MPPYHRYIANSNLTLSSRTADCFISRPSPYRTVNIFHLGYKNRSVHDINGTSRCLFSDKYKTHKYSVQLLNVKPVGASRN
jgi:hypothetical protein